MSKYHNMIIINLVNVFVTIGIVIGVLLWGIRMVEKDFVKLAA